MTRIIELDARKMTNRKEAHTYIAEQLSFRSYYGKNLDALHDCLTEISEPTKVIFTHSDELKKTLGTYGLTLQQVFAHAAEENKYIDLSFDYKEF